MAKPSIITIVDNKGEVWTGAEVPTYPTDPISSIVYLPYWLTDDRKSVKVNGVKHTGRDINKKKK
jgi:hypothetical protein